MVNTDPKMHPNLKTAMKVYERQEAILKAEKTLGNINKFKKFFKD